MISLSSIDQERFGIVTARDDHVSVSTVDDALKFCRANQVAMLIARCRSEDLAVAQRLEAAGGRLMDTLVYYVRVLVKEIPENTCRVTIRPLRPDDASQVQAVAAQAFRGYSGHYHADARLPRELCDAVYQSWAYRSCVSRDVAAEVLVADDDGQVAGFATLRLNEPREGEGVLFGVAPRAQGAGIYRAFMIEGMRWCRAQGATRMVVSTQLTNLAVQKVWTRLGFEPAHSFYTFHLWFDT